MKKYFSQTPLERELQRLNTQERRYMDKRREEKPSALNAMLEEKIPKTLQDTLQAAFAKAFSLIFEKGTGIIEKTYDKDHLMAENQADCSTILHRQDWRSLRDVAKKVSGTGRKNRVISGAIGIGMGAIGVGIPDIPVFSAMLLKSVYEIALRYGFSYDTEEEKYFILLVIQGALAPWEQLGKIEREIDAFIETELLPLYYNQEGQIHSTAAVLSGELLYMKFLQGMPIVGVIGGAYDVVYMKRVTEYAEMKYRKRFYFRMK